MTRNQCAISLILLAAIVAPGCRKHGGGDAGASGPTPGFTLTPTSGLVTTEAGGTGSFTVVLTAAPTADVTIALTTSNVNEGTPSPASLTFTTLDWNVAQTVTVTGVDDFADDGDVAYTILTGAAVSTDPGYTGLDPADVSVTNTDDDTAGVNVIPTAGLATTESGGTADFTVELNSLPTADVTISVVSNNTAEGTVSTALLTFTALNGTTPQTVTVTGVDDGNNIDGPIAYMIVLGACTSTDLAYNGINPTDVSVTNGDNDAPGVTVTPSGGLSTTEAGGTASFDVVLNTMPTNDVTITIVSTNTAEGTVSTALLTFTNLNGTTPQTVTITGIDDQVDDGDIAYTITTGNTSSTQPAYNNLTVNDVSVTNLNDDIAGITVLPLTPPALTTNESGAQATFTVQLNTIPTSPVTVAVVSSDTTEGTVSTALLTFAADVTALDPQTVTITGVQDLLQDGDIAYTINLGPASSIDTKYGGMAVSPVNVNNIDDDSPGVLVTAPSPLITTESGGFDTFTVVLKSIPSANVTIAVSSSNTNEGTVSTALLTFTPANALTPQTVTVTGVDDIVVDLAVNYTVVLAATSSTDPTYNGIDPADVACTNQDDENAPVGATGWAKVGTTPVLSNGTGGQWDGGGVTESTVIKLNATDYVMFYQGVNANGQKHERIGRADSTDGGATWTKHPSNPLLSHSGVNGTFDRFGVMGPSVIFDGLTWKMWFAGRANGGITKIGYATSSDGVAWTKFAGNPIMAGTNGTFDSRGPSSPSVLFDGTNFRMWYTGTDAVSVTRIGHATSADGTTWVKTTGAVLNTSASGFDAAGVRSCAVVLDGTTFRMWYSGLDVVTGGKLRIGYADSSNGTTWVKFTGNPVLGQGAVGLFDDTSVLAPWVIQETATTFKMWYTGVNAAGLTRIGYATIP